MVMTDLPAPRKKSEVHATTSGEVLGAADDLDQRDEVRRVEGMADDGSLRMGAPDLHLGHPVARCRRRDHDVRPVTASMSASNVRSSSRSSGALSWTKSARRRPPPGRVRQAGFPARSLGQSQLGERRPGLVDQVPEPRLGVLGRVPRHHAEPAGQEVRDPATADHACTHAGDGADVVRGGSAHVGVPSALSGGGAAWVPAGS